MPRRICKHCGLSFESGRAAVSDGITIYPDECDDCLEDINLMSDEDPDDDPDTF